jgi:hypothetical protein
MSMAKKLPKDLEKARAKHGTPMSRSFRQVSIAAHPPLRVSYCLPNSMQLDIIH